MTTQSHRQGAPVPRATFTNLPDDKRQRFINAALIEFSDRPYDQASISRIVARIGIAKGSVYQYFGGKMDLFSWLVEKSGHRKMAAVTAQPPPAEADLFARLRWIYLQGLVFMTRQPRWARIGLRAMEPSLDPGMAAMRRKHTSAAHSFLRAQLAQGQEEGAIRSDLDLDVVVPLVYGLLSEGLLGSFLRRAGVDDPLDPAVSAMSDEDALAVIDAALSMLQSGLGIRGSGVKILASSGVDNVACGL
ncbi:MAG: TetR/AcrR family transcriptional regulator [Myxococcota bacterium]|jgi:TetR/AcrR family transcriptional regulator